MKKIFRTVFSVLSLTLILSFSSAGTSNATVTTSNQISENIDSGISVIRTVENGVRYINIYLNDSILVMKVEEL